jgi:hypothetical protein
MGRTVYGTDLKVELGVLQAQGQWADLPYKRHLLQTLSEVDNLRQALALRLLVRKGELKNLSHPGYGTGLIEFVGEPLDSANLELLRRIVRKTLLEDERVEDVVSVVVRPLTDTSGGVQIVAKVLAILGKEITVETPIYA